RLARLQEELHYLEGLQAKVLVLSPVAGVIVTPHLRDKIGQFVHEGDLIGLVEEPGVLEAEIALTEQEVARIEPGWSVELKAGAVLGERALRFLRTEFWW